MLILSLLAPLAAAGPYEPAGRWLPGTLGALPPPWVVAVDPTEEGVAVLDGAGRVTYADADDLEVRWQVPVVRGEGPVHGALSFGPRGLAVAAGPRDEPVRVALLRPSDGQLEPLGRAPDGSRILDLRWTDTGAILTRTREPDAGNPIDDLVERTWGVPDPAERNLGTWFPHARYEAADADRVFVDVTKRGLGRDGMLEIDVRYRVWDDPWDPGSARALNDCPEWSEVVHVSADGRKAYTMGRIRCVYDLDAAEVIAWETKQVPFWSTLSPDGAMVVERHGKGGRRYGVVRNTADGRVQLELDDLEGAVFTRDAGLLVWTSHRLTARTLADGSVRWSLPLDGEVADLRVAPDAGSVALVERVADDADRVRVRVLSPEGEVRATVDDVEGVRGFSPGGRLLLLEARDDHLTVVDLRQPRSSGPPTHRAAVSHIRLDDQGVVVSGDEEGRVRRAVGTRVSAWRVPGEVRDLVVVGEEIVALSAEPPVPDEEPARWWVARWGIDESPRRPLLIAEDPRGAILSDDGSEAVVFTAEGAELGPAGRGRGRDLPDWRERGTGPDPEQALWLPGRERILAVPDSSTADKAAAWSVARKGPVGNYPVGLGRPAGVAASARRVLVIDERGGGRVFQLDGGGAVDLAGVDAGGRPCCGAIGGGVVAIATARGTVHLHDGTTGDVIQTLDPGFAAPLSAVAVSPAGDVVAVGSEGGELRSWRR